MSKIKVLIVDDSVVIRKIISEVLGAELDIEVAGIAANGRIALTKIENLKPDVVTLDIEMPEMDGLETISEIRKVQPKLPVIMFSSLTEEGASATLEALARGASTYVTKPANVGHVSEAKAQIRNEMIPKIRALCGRRAPKPGAGRFVERRRKPRPKLTTRVEVVAIGISTGGPNALHEVVSRLPSPLPVPILIAQHMPSVFTSYLADRLATITDLDVAEGEDGGVLQAGQIRIAPGDYHMTVARKGTDIITKLNQDPPENFCRPAVDPLFRSVAKVYRSNALSIVMTGMGHDGTEGAKAIKEAGGAVLIQDEESSVVWGMPGSVAGANLQDDTLPLSAIARVICQRVQFDRGIELNAVRPRGACSS